MKKNLVWILLFAVVIVAGCFHKPSPDTTGNLSWAVVETGDVADDAFDPNNFEDPEVKEVFDLLEELVQEDEAADQQGAEVDSGAKVNSGADTDTWAAE